MIVTAVAVFATAVIVYHNYNPEYVSWFPKCTFLQLTGYKCPGCGTQRALYYLLNGDIVKAFEFNKIFIIGLLYILIVIVLKLPIVQKSHSELYYKVTGFYVIIFWFVIVVLYWILRNIYDL